MRVCVCVCVCVSVCVCVCVCVCTIRVVRSGHLVLAYVYKDTHTHSNNTEIKHRP